MRGEVATVKNGGIRGGYGSANCTARSRKLAARTEMPTPAAWAARTVEETGYGRLLGAFGGQVE
jgi:hypothetical protein